MANIKKISTYISPHRIKVSNLVGELRLPEQTNLIMEKFGVEQVAVEKEKNIDEMLMEAAKKILEPDPSIVDTLGTILVTYTFSPIYPYLYEPLMKFQKEYGLEKAQLLSVAQMNCASLNLAIEIARRSVKTNSAKSDVLLLIGDKIMTPEMRYLNESTFSGDAAAAIYVSSDYDYNRIVSNSLYCEGKIYNSIESPESQYKWFLQSSPFGVVKVIRQALKEGNIPLDQIDCFFPSNVNTVLWNRVATMLDLPISKFYFPSLKDVGHAHNADPIINFEWAQKANIVKKNHYYGLISIGIGGTFGCTVIQH